MAFMGIYENYPEAVESLINGNRKDFFHWLQNMPKGDIIRFMAYLYQGGEYNTLEEIFRYWK